MEALKLHNAHLTVYRNREYDPTRTLTLRRNFEREMSKRFRELRGVIRRAIVDEDVFALQDPGLTTQQMQTPGNRRFNFPTNSRKVGAFMEWLENQVNNGILETTNIEQVGSSINGAWSNVYINDSYKRGVIRARAELKRAGYNVPDMEETGGIASSMSTPFHADRVGVLYTRAFNKLKGITDLMDTQISEVLAQGIADGDNPSLLARKLNATISGKGLGELGVRDTLGRFIPAERRARMLARTEIIRAHHQATIQEYMNWRVEQVRVKAEWITAGDNRVCEQCLAMEFEVFTLEEIRNLIPRHPLCRCIALPMRKGDQSARPTRSREPFMQDPVAKRFKSPEMAKKYMQFKTQYRQKLDEVLPDDMHNFPDEDLRFTSMLELARGQKIDKIASVGQASDKVPSFVMNMVMKNDEAFERYLQNVRTWQRDTHFKQAVSLKSRSSKLEKTPDLFIKDTRFPENFIKEADEYFSNDDYLKMRALNQAYMEKRGIDKVNLYRGTNGPEGEQIRNNIFNNASRQRTQFPIKDNSLAGYSDSVDEADNFGMKRRGVTVRNEFDRSDIVVHKDLLSGVTREFSDENEFITIGINKQISIKDMKMRGGGGGPFDGTKEFGKETVE